MKFFTKEMWVQLQDDKKTDYVFKIFNKKQKLYDEYLQRLKPKLSNNHLSFFQLIIVNTIMF